MSNKVKKFDGGGETSGYAGRVNLSEEERTLQDPVSLAGAGSVYGPADTEIRTLFESSQAYGDPLAGYEGVRNPLGAAVGAAQAKDAYASAVEEGVIPGDQKQFRYGFTDDPLVAAISYDQRIKEIEGVGGDASQLKEALTTIQDDYKQNQDIVDYLADIGLQQEAAAANDPPSLLDKGIDVAQKGIETVQDGINTVGTKVGEGIDKVFELLNLPNPTKIIGAPAQKSGTVVWGQTGGSPVIGAGTTGAGTQVGATTGNAGLDAILNRVTGVLTGKVAADEIINQDIIREILVGQASEELGVSVDAVEDGIEELNKVKDAVIPPTAYGVDLGKEPKIGSSGVEQLDVTGDMGALDTVTKGTRIPPATDKVKNKGVGADSKNKGVGAGEISDRVIGEGLKGTTPPPPDDSPPDDPPKVVIPPTDTVSPKGDVPVPKGDEPALKGDLPVEQSSGTFTGGIRTSPGELVDIDYFYDIGGESIFAPKAKSKEQEDPLAYLYSGYADGGIVKDSDVQQFIQYLMGTRG